jgi:hypothetical protein
MKKSIRAFLYGALIFLSAAIPPIILLADNLGLI